MARVQQPWLVAIAVLGAAACGGTDPVAVDAADLLDAAAVDGPDQDGPEPDGGGPRPGFGAITGQCGVLGPAELAGTEPLWFQGELTFDNRYDDPAERPLLTPGGVEIILDGNAGGSSLYSEVFAYEWLARCEGATLVKTETEIAYDTPDSKRADLLVEIDGVRVGVSVTRAVRFPFGREPYTLAAATELFDRKLDDIHLATLHAVPGDRWAKQMVAALAYDLQHAQVAMEAWQNLDAETRGDTLLIVAVTTGDDRFIYTDQ